MKSRSLFWDNPNDIRQLVEALKNGYACIGSSDTVIGLMAPLTETGFLGLNTIKGRSQKPYIALVGSYMQVEQYVYMPKELHLQELLKACWPGPLTVILKLKDDRLKSLQSEKSTIAVRIPDHSGLLSLLRQVEGIFSTSANKAGKEVPLRLAEVDPDILQSVAYAITDRDPKETSTPSTIIDCSQEDLVLVREGAISFAKLTELIESLKRTYL